MNANELRIGNWLRSAESFKQEHREPFYFQVSAEDIVSIWEGHSYAQPIPLTPEILERAGFIRNIAQNTFDLRMAHNGSSGLLSIEMDDYSFTISHDHEMGFAGNVLNLHQLQNLYFALTATELEINLNKEK